MTAPGIHHGRRVSAVDAPGRPLTQHGSPFLVDYFKNDLEASCSRPG